MPDERSEYEGNHPWSGIDAAGKGAVGVDASGAVVFATPVGARLLGREVDDLVGSRVSRLTTGDEDDAAALERLRSVAADADPASEPSETVAFRRGDGDTVELATTVEAAEFDDREGLVVVVHDREHYRHDGGLSSARRTTGDPAYTVGMFREVFENLNDALLVTDPEREVVRACNPRALDLLGYDREELLSLAPSELFGPDAGAYREFVDTVREEGAGWTDDLGCRTGDDATVPVEVSVAVVEFDGDIRMLWSLRDSTDRLARERHLRLQAAAMESSIDGMAVVDAEDTYVYVNGALAELYGYDSPEALVGEPWLDTYDDAARGRLEREVLPALAERGYWRGETVGRRADGTAFEQELSLATVNGGGLVATVRDVSDRKAAERQLQALNMATRDLLLAETDTEVAERGVEAVRQVIGFRVACIRLFDLETNAFDIVATTGEADRLMRSRPAFNLRSTHAGRAYRRGETVLNREPDDDGPYGEDAIRAGLHVPLADYGVLTVLTTGEESVDERDVALVELLASDVAMVLEHTRRERLLGDHERELLVQRDRLRTLGEINDVMREIIQRLPHTTTHEEIGETVCRCLVHSDLYRYAWVGETDANGEVEVTAGDGVDEAFVRTGRRATRPGLTGDDVEDAIETREIQVTRQYVVTDADANADADDEHTEFEAVVTVPILRRERVDEVLVVATDRRDAFSDPELAEFELLGETIGFVVSSIATRKLLIADSVVELDVEVAGGGDVFLALSDRLDAACTVEESVPLRGRRLLQYVSVEGASPEAAYDLAAATEGVEARRTLDAHDDATLLELVVSGSPVHDLIDLGVKVRSFVATDGTGRVVVEAPSSVDVRSVVDLLRDHYGDVTMLAKRERPRGVETVGRSVGALDGFLTDRQRAAIRAAYAAGYYDWPRKSTAEEVAASLDITSATLHQHLRKAEEKLLQTYLGDATDPPVTVPDDGR
jgi:PAS domain S-box-containing protein